MKRTPRTGHSWPVRIFSTVGVAAGLALAAAPLPVPAFAASAKASSAWAYADQTVADFYRARGDRPLWYGTEGRQVDVLLELLETSRIDGLDPKRYRIGAIRKAASQASNGDRRAVRRAETMLSNALVAYAGDVRRAGADTKTIYVDPELKPAAPSPRAILEAAASAPSLEDYVARLGWMHPMYGELRHALMLGFYDKGQRQRIIVNLDRARELPGMGRRHVLVNAAAQRLFMYEDGRVVDSMRVVVGKPIYPTPMMAAMIRYAALNPYWYVPPDLAAERIAPSVVREGEPYIKRQGYQVVSDFRPDPEIIDWRTIDWKAVADGTSNVLIRQLPGAHNSMGRIKFMFPNKEGVYLHDNPERELFEEASRLYSGGCVRLESAWRLSEWLFDRELTWKGADPEEKVPLNEPVPVFITYLTAVPSSNFQVAFYDDIYGRDARRIAEMHGDRELASRR